MYCAGAVTVKDSAVISEDRGLYVAEGKSVTIEGALTPSANIVGSADKSFNLIVQAPENATPFLVDQTGNAAQMEVRDVNNLPLLPSAVSRAPDVEGGLNTLYVSWRGAALATSYVVYYGTSTNPTTLLTPEPTGTSVTITTGIADSTIYYVRIQSKNSVGVSTTLSPLSTAAVTADAFPADIWGKYNSGLSGGGGSDKYRLIEEPKQLLYGLDYYEQSFVGTGMSFKGPIVYHISFGHENLQGVGGQSIGNAGVIIIKFDGQRYPSIGETDYYGIYYWGQGEIITTPNGQQRNRLFMANAFATNSANWTTPKTLKAAKELFTYEKRPLLVHFGVVYPQYKVEEED